MLEVQIQVTPWKWDVNTSSPEDGATNTHKLRSEDGDVNSVVGAS